MTLIETTYKVRQQITNRDRNYFHDHALNIPRHLSESKERVIVQLLAFALHADEALKFVNEQSADDAPDLWIKDVTGNIELWINIGLPDEKLAHKACSLAKRVVIYSYGGHVADMWWSKNKGKLKLLKNLTVINLPLETSRSMEKMVQPNMQLNFTIQDGTTWLANQENTMEVELIMIKKPSIIF